MLGTFPRPSRVGGAGVLLMTVCFACAPAEPPAGTAPEAWPAAPAPRGGPGVGTYRPNPDFRPVPAVSTARRPLSTAGEVIVLDGADPRFVTVGAGGGFGITDDNQVAIAQEVLANYPDVFDTIQIYLSFLDANHPGSAYYQGIKNDVAGIGRMIFDGRGGWGLPPEGRLSGFSNMNIVDLFGPLSEVGRVRSGYHAVVAQELTHRWLFFFTFEDASGDNPSLLGRDQAHWSRLAQANGSVQDGNRWRELEDGRFLMEGHDDAFSPLDLYGMGIYGPAQVPPFFYLTEATLDGMPLEPTSRIAVGARVQANKIPVKIEQVVASLTPRNPPVGTETPYYRAAFVFIHAPGQPEEEYGPYLEATQAVQASFPETYKSWTGGAGAICTKTTERCPEPLLDLDGAAVEDGGDDLIAPGESVELALRVRNDGLGTAENVRVTLRSLDGKATVDTATITAPAIAQATAVELGTRFRITAAADVACGGVIQLEMQATAQEGPKFRRKLELVVGNTTLATDALDEGPDWTANPDGDDSATAGAWALDVPQFASLLGVVTQPGSDASPGASKLAFMTGPAKGSSPTDRDVDGGRTTLESPIFAIESARDPTLVFQRWFVARDFAMGRPVSGAALTVLGSSDGGQTYTELASFTENTAAWTRTSIRLRDALTITNRMRFRFVATDPSQTGIVEAGVDDLALVDVLEACVKAPPPTPTGPTEEDSGCSAVRGGDLGVWAAVAVLWACLRRRRRP